MATASPATDSVCPICNKEFKNAKGLKIHVAKMHKGVINHFEPQEMNKNVSPCEKEEEVSTDRDSSCPICKREFKNTHGLNVHISRMHKGVKECKDLRPCKKEEEVRTEGESLIGRYLMTSSIIPGKPKITIQDLEREIKTKKEEKSNVAKVIKDLKQSLKDSSCPICKREFKNIHGLNVHISRMHKGVKECKDLRPCKKEEEVRTEGEQIWSRVHKEDKHQLQLLGKNNNVSRKKEEEENTEGDSSCRICKREFKNTHGLNVHISRMHKGVKECKDLRPCKKEEEVRTEGEQIWSRVHKEDKHQLQLLGKNNNVSRKKEEEESTEGESLIGRYLMTSSTIPGKPKITIQDLEREIKTKKEEKNNVAKVIKDLKQSLEKFLCHNSVEFNIMNSGSYYDLTKIQRTDEFDFMFCTKFVGTPVLDGPPGYCRIRIEDRNRDQIKEGLMTQNGFLCPQKFKQCVFDMFEEQLSRSDFHKARKLKRKDRDKDSPAYTVEYTAIPGHPIDIDLVPSVTLSGWPGETIQKPSWLVKPIDEKKLSEHHAVAKTCTEDIPNAKSLWRVSFSGAESALMKAANDGNYESSRKFVFKVLKLILTKAKEKSETMKRFCSYHLKMFMFEQFEQWEKGEDGKFFKRKQLLKTLSELHKRLQQNPAVIWNYFIKDDNIIRHVSREELNEVIKALDKAFRDIIENDDKTLLS